MSRETGALEQLEFLQALVKRGFVPIPRMLSDYGAYLELDYDTIGKIFTVLALVGNSGESAFGDYAISRKEYPHDFDHIRNLIKDLEEKDLVRSEEETDRIAFSFIPLYSRLRALWVQDLQRWEEASATEAKDPAVAMAEQLFGRPLSDREVSDILDWVDTYGFGPDMVKAVIDEGKSQGILRMTYLNQIARQWFEAGIKTPEQAVAHANQYRQAVGKHKRIVRYLGLGRPLNGAELGLLDKWTEEWGFSDEVVMRAAEEAAGVRNPLQYMNRVLENWRANGARTLADVDRLLSERRSRTRGEGSAPVSRRTATSNVLLHREKKDDDFYDHLYKKFGE